MWEWCLDRTNIPIKCYPCALYTKNAIVIASWHLGMNVKQMPKFKSYIDQRMAVTIRRINYSMSSHLEHLSTGWMLYSQESVNHYTHTLLILFWPIWHVSSTKLVAPNKWGKWGMFKIKHYKKTHPLENNIFNGPILLHSKYYSNAFNQ